MAMLEAFVHDPLINWRLLTPSPPRQTQSQTQGADAAAGAADGTPRILFVLGYSLVAHIQMSVCLFVLLCP